MKNSFLEKINKILKEQSFKEEGIFILEILSDKKYIDYFISHFPKKHSDLTQIDFILDQLINNEKFYNGPYMVFGILKESVSEKNNEFIIKFLKDNYELFEQKKHFNESSLDLIITILNKIIKEDNEQADEILEIVQKILKRGKNLRDLRAGQDYEKQLTAELLEYISNIYFERKNDEKIEELVDIIKNNFNLVDDDGRMQMYTSNKVFEILRKYIDLDFKNNFQKVKEIIIKQYQKFWKNDFKGWELIGGGISQSGSHFSISDRHFNEFVFTPAINNYYEKAEDKNKAWNFIKANCYVSQKDVSAEKPDFLSRAIIKLLFKRFNECEGKNKNEVFEIIKEFIDMRKGIPHKTDLIYQHILNNEKDLSNEEKWAFAQISLNAKWNKKNIAVNIFIERIIGELVEKKHQYALEWMEKNIREGELVSGGYYRESGTIEIISKLLNSKDSKNKGAEMLHAYVKTEKFYNKLDRFEVFSVADLLARVFEIQFEKGMEIVNEVYLSDNLTTNQQILITSGVNKITEIKNKKRIFDEFLIEIFKELGEIEKADDIKNEIAEKILKSLLKKFDHDYARVAIVELGESLAKAKYFQEAMVIARIFINDPDPRIDDKEFNYHEEIKKGKEGGNTISISTARGWVCWLLSHIPVLDGQSYVKEVIEMVKKLSQDENYYIRCMATFPLVQLVQNRHTVIKAGTTDRFISKELAKEIEDIAFAMLRKEENRNLKAVMFGITRVFNYMRSLDMERAIEVLNYFRKVDNRESLENIVSLFIFFAEFRKNAFIGGIWEDDDFGYLKDFDDSQIKSLLEEILRSDNEKIKASFAWKFSVLTDEGKTEEDKREGFNISLKYLKILSESYSPEVYNSIYRFINDHIPKFHSECISLFKDAIEKEKMALKELPADHEYQLTSQRYHYYFEQIFDEMFKQNKNDYLDNFELVMKLPPSDFLSNSLISIAKHLLQFESKNERIDKIFDYLIEKVSPDFYDLKMEWEKKR